MIARIIKGKYKNGGNKLRIAYLTDFFSEKMGYFENCLPKAMASLGHEVHVIASNLQAYGNLPSYQDTYGKYLGPRIQECGTTTINGFKLHRLPHNMHFGYVGIQGLVGKLFSLKPEILHVNSCVSSNALKAAICKKLIGYKLYSECHQHMSVAKGFLRKKGLDFRKIHYLYTRTLPGRLISIFTTKCFPVAPDCAEIATKFYGVEKRKIQISSLGTDTELFTPVHAYAGGLLRIEIRRDLGVGESDILCVYSGRFSKGKNPLLLALAVTELRKQGLPYRGLFIGDGDQKEEIEACDGCIIIPFVPYLDLPKHYCAADIGVWPTQESMSMLDAASCGLPIVVSDRIGELERVEGNGKVYEEGNVEDLARVLHSLSSEKMRRLLGDAGRRKMQEKYSWLRIAKDLIKEYQSPERTSC